MLQNLVTTPGVRGSAERWALWVRGKTGEGPRVLTDVFGPRPPMDGGR